MLKLTPPTKAFIGIFVVFSFALIFFIYLGIENMWFDNSKIYKTKLSEADGLRNGTLVTLSGLRVGEVIKLKVDDDNKIIATFKVKSSLAHKMKEGTIIRVVRSFVIGDKRLDITPGPKENAAIPEGGEILGIESFEIADLLSGKKVGEMVGKMEALINGLNTMSTSFTLLSQKVKPEELVSLYELLLPTVKKLNQVLINADGVLVEVAKEKSSISPLVKNSSALLATSKKQFIDNELLFNTLTSADKITRPIAGDEKLIKNMIVALNETIITLKAIQRTWMLSSHVKAVEEEAKKAANPPTPAAEP